MPYTQIELTEQTQAALQALAAQTGLTESALIRAAVERLIETAESTPVNQADSPTNGGEVAIKKDAWNPRELEMKWIHNPANRANYEGQWVIVEGNQLIAHGFNHNEVFAVGRDAGIRVPFIHYFHPNDKEPFVGGWV